MAAGNNTTPRLRLPLADERAIAAEVRRLYRSVKLGQLMTSDAANMAAVLAVLAGLI